jgi:acyl-CoA synthetase (AMP-forming)/AMP-acid ligase II
VVYCTLPIYHANGGLIGIGMALVSGATVVLRKKFSASNFWKDCIEYKCTAIVYVGELLRYLVNQPESHLDKKHSVRIALGNGLRSNVWTEFVKRFGVKPIEFYAASEGNCTLSRSFEFYSTMQHFLFSFLK